MAAGVGSPAKLARCLAAIVCFWLSSDECPDSSSKPQKQCAWDAHADARTTESYAGYAKRSAFRILSATRKRHARWLANRAATSIQDGRKMPFRMKNRKMKEAPEPPAQLLAGAGGIEPPHGGIKIPCLTAWRRPNSLFGSAATRPPANSLRQRRSIERGEPFQPDISRISSEIGPEIRTLYISGPSSQGAARHEPIGELREGGFRGKTAPLIPCPGE